jgi:hypothetical protein
MMTSVRHILGRPARFRPPAGSRLEDGMELDYPCAVTQAGIL